ncbi:MAG TPA: hypothetical protein VHW24_21810, partial [Bryobacteraceae bacterium]|nr:hypothetical protein [Bryobacteraceae bacterium]
MNAARRRVSLLAILALALRAQSPPPAASFTAPAGIRQAMRREAASILPGGRIVSAFGREYATGPGPFAIALSPTGHIAAIANTGPWRYTITVLDRDRSGHWEPREIDARSPASLDEFGIPKIQSGDWRGISNGIAFSAEHAIWVSEGNSGRVALYDSSEDRRRAVDINGGKYLDSYTSALTYDPAGILYVADQANARVAVIDTKSRQVISSVHVGSLPFALTLSPDRQKLYVANLGVFDYHLLPNVNASNAATAGLPFPAPWPATAADSPETNSLAIVDVSTPAAPKLEGFVKVGFSPSAVVAAKDQVFVSCANDDSIAIVDPATRAITARIPLQIPGQEQLRGVIPLGMAFDEPSGWLLVAEAGINALAVVDTRAKRVLGHIPTSWYPTSVALDDGEVLVGTARGHGIGPDAPTNYSSRGSLLPSALFQGSVSIFKLPAAADLAPLTESVMRNAGFARSPLATPPPLPAPPPVRHVVLIVKEGRTFDELLGDLHSSPPSAMNDAAIARYGLSGFADGGHARLSLKGVRVTPNTHAIATQFAYSDNFYADGDGTVDGHHWLQGAYPNAWTRSSLNAAYGNLKDFRISAAPGRLAFPGMASSLTPEDAPPGANLWDHLAGR